MTKDANRVSSFTPQSIRLFARTAALLAILCEALPPGYPLQSAGYLNSLEVLLPTVRRLWSPSLTKIPLRPEVNALLARIRGLPSHASCASKRLLLRKLVRCGFLSRLFLN